MMSTRASSTDRGSSFSTASGAHSAIEPVDQLLLRIKEKYVEVKLIQFLETNIHVCYGIKDLLKKVDILTTPPEITNVIIELGFLIDEVTADLLCKQDTLTKIEKENGNPSNRIRSD